MRAAHHLLILALIAAPAAAVLAALPEATHPGAVPIAGKPFEARLTHIDGQWRLTFATQNGNRDIFASDLVGWGGRVEIERGPLIVLADDSVVVAAEVQLHEGQVRASTGLWGALTLPVDKVRGVIFTAPITARRFDGLLSRIQTSRNEADQVLLNNGDVVGGSVVAIKEERLRLLTPSGEIDLDLDRVPAVLMRTAPHSPQRPEGVHALLGFRDGSLVKARSAMLDNAQLRITTAAGVDFVSGLASDASHELVSLETLNGKAVYLSDLTPLGFRHIPYLTLSWPLAMDRNVAGGQLRADGVIYSKGMGVHSTARVVYQLDGQYDRFAADLAIDDSVGRGNGSVIFRVYVDQPSSSWREIYRSPIVRGGQRPVSVSMDIDGAERLALVVEFADRADQLDHANWLGAHVTKRP